MSLCVEEQETVVNFSRNDDKAKIYTSDSTIVTKLSKLCSSAGTGWKLEKVHKDRKGAIIAYTYSCPKKCISFRKMTKERSETL